MSRFKTKSKQALTILLALLLFFAMVPSTLPGGLAYATEWVNTSTETRGVTLSTDKAVYNEGETIRYTIPDFSSSSHAAFNQNQLWLGLYEYGAADGYNTSIKWEYINSDIEDNSLQEDLGYTFAPGKYHLIVTTGGGGNDVSAIWATLDFTVVGNNITTDKDTYELSEPIMTTANFVDGGYFWVGLYGKDENPNGGPQSIYWYDGHNGEAYNLKAGTRNRELTPGEYKVILFGDGGFTKEVAVKNITIIEDQVTTSISTDKDIYAIDEPIMVTATSAVDGVWVSLLAKSDSVNDQSYYWYYVADHNGEAFNIYNAVKNKDVTADGEYKLLVMQDVSGTYTALAEKDIFIGEYKEPDISVNKEADTDGYAPYKYGEPVLVTAQGSDASTKVRICDATPGDPHGFDNGEYVSFYVKDVTGSVDVVKMAEEQGTPLVYGKKYRAYLCINQDGDPNHWVKQAKFKLLETFGDPTWTWNDTFTKATATFTSKSDPTVTKPVDVTGADITNAVTKEATEEEEGIRTYTATLTADKIDFVTENDPPFTGTATEAIPKLSHVHEIVKVPAVEATCETDGNIEYFKCTGCNKYFEDAEGTKEITDKSTVVIPAKGHAWGEWTFDLETKTHTRVCANDPAHKETQDCTFTHQPSSDPDTELYTCTVCGGQYEQLTIPVITTDKTEYLTGEDILVTTELNGNDGATTGGWIALYDKNDTSYSTSMLWYYPAYFENPKLLQSVLTPSDTNLENLGTLKGDQIPPGEYQLVFAVGTYPGPYDIVGQPAYFKVSKRIKSEEITKEPTCTETGIKHIIYEDDTSEDVEIDALGHDPKEAWVHDAEERTHYHECSRCDAHIDEAACTFDEGKVTKEATATEEGEMLYTCTVCGGTYTEVIPTLANQGVKRVYGDTRFQTALLQANELKEFLGLEKFPSIIVATGANYADALSGAYLGYVKGAPILLVQNSKSDVVADVNAYIKDNIAPGGTVYLLGGEAVVTGDVTKGLDVTTKRLSGATRYETNIEILKEAKVNKESILVCDGNNYADSLSASAAKLPILLVKGGLNDTQRDYLNTLPGNDYYLVGGTGVLPVALENELKNDFGAVERLGGADRYETSTKVAEKFFEKPEKAVVAYAMNYPDGLCGGTLAAYMNAPLLLVRDDKVAITEKYSKAAGIKSGVVLGGSTLVSDKSVRTIFEMADEDEIYVVNKMVPMTE